MNRREFLRLSANSKQREGKPVLVTLFLRGGADTLNMLVPYGDDEYYRQRKKLSIPPPTRSGFDSKSAIKFDELYGFHPFMKPMLPMFYEGRLAMVQGVGCDSPEGSHFYMQGLIERGVTGNQSVDSGWLARHLSSRPGGELSAMSAMAMGRFIPKLLQGAPSVGVMENFDDLQMHGSASQDAELIPAIQAMYGEVSGELKPFGISNLRLLEKVKELKKRDYRPEADAQYPATNLGKQMMQMARLIKSNVGLEVGCIDFGDWDTHKEQGTFEGSGFPRLLDDFSRSFAAFDRDLLPVRDKVTVVVMTEFGRRSYDNSSGGTDHGRGCVYMVLGDQVNGGKVLGAWSGLVEEEVGGPNGLHIQYDYRSVFAEVVSQGLGNPNVDIVFPEFQPQNIGLIRS